MKRLKLRSSQNFEFMIPAPIGTLIRSVTRYSIQKCSLSSASTVNPSYAVPFFRDAIEGSAAYRQKLKTQRPSTIKRWSRSENSVRFIGNVVRPLALKHNTNGRLGVYTYLNVKNRLDSDGSFRLLLTMWDEMAEICIQHLKQNDLIYISGHLKSYTKQNEDGELGIYYQVIVKELNYVAQHGHSPASTEQKKSEVQGGEAGVDRYRNKLHLWQVFLHNPYEWWDNRKNKKNPRQPDFKHKDTGEVLWIEPNDPPWLKRQLDLLDSRMEELGEPERYRSCVSTWVYDE